MRNTFNGLSNRHSVAEERISTLKDRAKETSQTEMQKVKNNERKNNTTSKDCGTILKVITYVLLKCQEKKERELMKQKKYLK